LSFLTLNGANLRAIQHTKTLLKSVFHKKKNRLKKIKRELAGLSPKTIRKRKEFSFYYKYSADYLQIESDMFCSTKDIYLSLFLIVNKL